VQVAHLEYQLDDSILTQRVVRLRVGAGDVCEFSDRVASKLLKKLDVPGFRRGKAPLAYLRWYHWQRIAGETFEELRRAAVQQVLERFEDKDKPFLPPQVLRDTEDGIVSTDQSVGEHPSKRLKYGEDFEFAVKYLVDPSQIGRQPENPQMQVEPGAAHQLFAPHNGHHTGIPSGPILPSAPGVSGISAVTPFGTSFAVPGVGDE
jgi:hypothetical protein